MAGSGMEEVLEHCYAANTVKQMLLGNASSHALHGCFFIAAALKVLLLKHLLPGNVGRSVSLDNSLSREHVSALTHLYQDSLDSSATDIVEAVKLQRTCKITKNREGRCFANMGSHQLNSEV